MRAPVSRVTELLFPGMSWTTSYTGVSTARAGSPTWNDPSTAPAGWSTTRPVLLITGRDNLPTNAMTYQAGSVFATSGAACHDPACPATTHGPLAVEYVARGTGTSAFIVVTPSLAATVSGWQPFSKSRTIPVDATQTVLSCDLFINQATNGTCRWWVADATANVFG